jgi:hypothetical protein
MELPSDLNSLVGKHIYYVGSIFKEGTVTKIESLEPTLKDAKVWIDDCPTFELLSRCEIDQEEAFYRACDWEDYWRDIACKLNERNE